MAGITRFGVGGTLVSAGVLVGIGAGWTGIGLIPAGVMIGVGTYLAGDGLGAMLYSGYRAIRRRFDGSGGSGGGAPPPSGKDPYLRGGAGRGESASINLDRNVSHEIEETRDVERSPSRSKKRRRSLSVDRIPQGDIDKDFEVRSVDERHTFISKKGLSDDNRIEYHAENGKECPAGLTVGSILKAIKRKGRELFFGVKSQEQSVDNNREHEQKKTRGRH